MNKPIPESSLAKEIESSPVTERESGIQPITDPVRLLMTRTRNWYSNMQIGGDCPRTLYLSSHFETEHCMEFRKNLLIAVYDGFYKPAAEAIKKVPTMKINQIYRESAIDYFFKMQFQGNYNHLIENEMLIEIIDRIGKRDWSNYHEILNSYYELVVILGRKQAPILE